jgi:hypothetical protein
MLGVMYRITKDVSGSVILVCLDCPHTERVIKFDHHYGSPRTQAARAVLKHALNEHGKEPIGKPQPQVPVRKY